MTEAGRGGPRGRRVAVAAALVILAVVAAAVYAQVVPVAPPPDGTSTQPARTLSAPGEPCTDPLLPAAVLNVEEDAQFQALSGGLCYSFLGQGDPTSESAGAATTYTFDYYNGSVVYPCGDLPEEAAASQVQVVAIANGSVATVETALLESDAPSLDGEPGPKLNFAVKFDDGVVALCTCPLANVDGNFTVIASSPPTPK